MSWMIRHKLGKRAHLSIQADWLCVRRLYMFNRALSKLDVERLTAQGKLLKVGDG
jgi:hypothetical protein